MYDAEVIVGRSQEIFHEFLRSRRVKVNCINILCIVSLLSVMQKYQYYVVISTISNETSGIISGYG